MLLISRLSVVHPVTFHLPAEKNPKHFQFVCCQTKPPYRGIGKNLCFYDIREKWGKKKEKKKNKQKETKRKTEKEKTSKYFNKYSVW